MQKLFVVVCVFFLFAGCSQSDDNLRQNPYLADVSFRTQLNLNLPEYNDLQYPGNAFILHNVGVKGVVVYNVNNSQYVAYELSDPNHAPSSCSKMEVNGVIATCPCDDNSYNVITGDISEGDGEFTMKPYRIQRSGSVLEIWN